MFRSCKYTSSVRLKRSEHGTQNFIRILHVTRKFSPQKDKTILREMHTDRTDICYANSTHIRFSRGPARFYSFR